MAKVTGRWEMRDNEAPDQPVCGVGIAAGFRRTAVAVVWSAVAARTAVEGLDAGPGQPLGARPGRVPEQGRARIYRPIAAWILERVAAWGPPSPVALRAAPRQLAPGHLPWLAEFNAVLAYELESRGWRAIEVPNGTVARLLGRPGVIMSQHVV